MDTALPQLQPCLIQDVTHAALYRAYSTTDDTPAQQQRQHKTYMVSLHWNVGYSTDDSLVVMLNLQATPMVATDCEDLNASRQRARQNYNIGAEPFFN